MNYRERGNILKKYNNYSGSLKFYTFAINLYPNNIIFKSNRSSSLLFLGRYEESMEESIILTKLDNEYEKALRRQGLTLFYLKR